MFEFFKVVTDLRERCTAGLAWVKVLRVWHHDELQSGHFEQIFVDLRKVIDDLLDIHNRPKVKQPVLLRLFYLKLVFVEVEEQILELC